MKKINMKFCVVVLVCSCLLLIVALVATGEKITYHENGVLTYFLEPENHVIAKVDVLTDSFLFDKIVYGYIANEDYQAYLDGTLKGVLVVKHPYENGKSVGVPVNLIECIETGIYENHR